MYSLSARYSLLTHTFSHSPDETPFSRDLPEPVLPPLPFPNILYPNNINANPSILSFYTRYFVPRLTRRATLALARKKRANGIMGDEEFEDDGNYGSAATIDVEILQYISKRVHYGTWRFHPPLHWTLANTEPTTFRQVRFGIQVPSRPCCIHPPHPQPQPNGPRSADHQARSRTQAPAASAPESLHLRPGSDN